MENTDHLGSMPLIVKHNLDIETYKLLKNSYIDFLENSTKVLYLFKDEATLQNIRKIFISAPNLYMVKTYTDLLKTFHEKESDHLSKHKAYIELNALLKNNFFMFRYQSIIENPLIDNEDKGLVEQYFFNTLPGLPIKVKDLLDECFFGGLGFELFNSSMMERIIRDFK